MDLLSMNVFRPSAQVSSILSYERCNSTSTSSTSSSFSSSSSLVRSSHLRYSNKWKSSLVRCKSVFCVRASQSNGDNPQEPYKESFSIEEITSDLDARNERPASPTTNAGNQLSQEQLREVLNTLSQSLAVLSSAMSEVSSAVRVLSASLLVEQPQPNVFEPPFEASETKTDAPGEEDPFADPPEPWDTSTMPTIPSRNVDEVVDGSTHADSSVPERLVEQNRLAHRLAYRLQQSFTQARIDGLGKPFEVAVEEFASTCLEAHQKGIGLKELQLQLILQDGSLTGAFALRSQRFSNDPIFDEVCSLSSKKKLFRSILTSYIERDGTKTKLRKTIHLRQDSRVRSLWVRLVYSTLAELEEMEKPTRSEESTDGKNAAEVDGTETFVKQVIRNFVEEGYNLARIKLEQNFAGQTTSPSIKAMRQNHYLVLLVVDKVYQSKQDGKSMDEKQNGDSVDEAS